MTIGKSKGGIPAATPLETFLALTDSQLGASVVAECSATGSLSPAVIKARFAALGRLVRAGSQEEQETLLSRPETARERRERAPRVDPKSKALLDVCDELRSDPTNRIDAEAWLAELDEVF